MAVFAVAAACGSPSPPPIAIEEFPAAAKDALCAWSVRCRHVPDDATCRRLIDPRDYDVRRAIDAALAGRLAWDPDAAGRCVASVAGAVCAAAPFSDLTCDEMIVGLVPRGGACASDHECAGGARCEGTTCDAQCCAGTCGAPIPTIPPALAGAGEPCATHPDCEVGLYCELDRRCAPLPDEEGEHCLFGCAWGDLYCDVDTETCRRFASLDEECEPIGIAPPCDPAYAFCSAGRCAPRPGLGAACDESSRICIASLWCDRGVCVEPGGAGAPCAAHAQCEVACDQDRCAAYATCAP